MSKQNLIIDLEKEILEDFLHQTPNGVVLSLKVKPGAKIEKLFISSINEVCLSVKAPALENAANVRVIELISQLFSIPKSNIEIISGTQSQHKRVLIKKETVDSLIGRL